MPDNQDKQPVLPVSYDSLYPKAIYYRPPQSQLIELYGPDYKPQSVQSAVVENHLRYGTALMTHNMLGVREQSIQRIDMPPITSAKR